MDDLFNILDGIFGMSKATQKPLNPDDFKKWKHCVALAKLGWKATDNKKEENSDITITWQKEGKKDLQIRLSFTEQCLWLEYMEKKEKKNGTDI